MNRRQHGFTLIELMVTVSVIGILAAVAMPSFSEMIGRRRLEGAIAELRNDMQFVRTEALRRNRTATLTVNGSGTGYTISYPDTSNTAVKSKDITLPDGVTLTANASVSFNPMRGTTTAAVSFVGESNRTSADLQINVDLMGRVHVCSPQGSFGGYATC